MEGQTAAVRTGTAHSLRSLLSCIRFGEVLMLQGSPLLGALFSMHRLTVASIAAMALLTLGSICLVAHVFVLNDWSGVSADLRDPNKTRGVFLNRGVTRAGIGFLGAALLALSLLLFAPLGTRTVEIAAAIAGLSATYSYPAAHIKGIPVLNSVIHFAGGLLHFLLGYSVFSSLDVRGIEIGCFFALLFVAGHLTHETRDSDGDGASGIRTNAVTFGKKQSFIAGMFLFTTANAVLVVLALCAVVPRSLIGVTLLFPLHIYWWMRTMHAGLTFENVRWLQMRYRSLYATIGLVMVAVVLGAQR